ncbi:hypothetical protein CPC08DRAFT_770350 [Agrocybe pediades]|nr:hypothetical protein CPC08DRAFT_770350 [Agrocybe pediades]
MCLKLLSIPGLPNPSRYVPFPPISDFIQLKSFDVSSDPNSKSLNIRASASLLNPAPPTINLTVPSPPFTILIPFTMTNLLPTAADSPEPTLTFSVAQHYEADDERTPVSPIKGFSEMFLNDNGSLSSSSTQDAELLDTKDTFRGHQKYLFSQ